MLFGLSLFPAPVEPPTLPGALADQISCTDVTEVAHSPGGHRYSLTEDHFDADGRLLASVTTRDDGTQSHTVFSGSASVRSWLEIHYDSDGLHWLGHGFLALDATGRNRVSVSTGPQGTRVRAWEHEGDRSVVRELGPTPGTSTTTRGPYGPVERIVLDASGIEVERRTWTYDAIGRVRTGPDDRAAPMDPFPLEVFWSFSATDRCAPNLRDTAAVVAR